MKSGKKIRVTKRWLKQWLQRELFARKLFWKVVRVANTHYSSDQIQNGAYQLLIDLENLEHKSRPLVYIYCPHSLKELEEAQNAGYSIELDLPWTSAYWRKHDITIEISINKST